MMLGAAARACNAASELPREEQGSPLLDVEKGRCEDCTTETPTAIKAAERAVKFIIRGLLLLMGVYLFNSMKRYAINYTGGDTGFSTFAVIVVAVPIAQLFCILGQPPTVSSAPCRACGYACTTGADNAAPKEVVDVVLLDLEKESRELDMNSVRILKCIIQGLLALPWVYLVDLLRRYATTRAAEELIFTMGPLVILAAIVTLLFCFLMESLGECIPPPEPSCQTVLELKEDE